MIARVFTAIVIVTVVLCEVSAFGWVSIVKVAYRELIYRYCLKNKDSRNVLFIILSQEEPYQASVAARLKRSIEEQISNVEKRLPKILLTHEDYKIPGSWTIKPLLGPIASKYKYTDVRWVVFVESHTAVKTSILLEALRNSDSQKHIDWLGYPLSDDEPTIIHHFAMYEELDEEGGFVYPYFASGVAMRMELISSLASKLDSRSGKSDVDFSIDPSYELAQLIYGDSYNRGPLMSPEMSFCVISGDNCATYPRHFDVCGSPIREDSIVFAVKTWSGFHSTRVKIVKKTWGKHVTNLMFFSDKPDSSIPTIDLGIANTKSGHCAKTVAILRYLVNKIKSMPHIKWIFLADDDTILGVHRLCEVLSCYRGGGSDVTILGERYGYGYTFGNKNGVNKGYDYITGGGGIAMSVEAVRALSTCACAQPHSPDDMTLGACATLRLNISLTHSPLFHQARPQDYPREVLARDRPVSFHKHSSPEPIKVYATWFQHEDLALKRRTRDEL